MRIVELGLAKGRVLDFGCGYGFDADHFGWEAYDPFYGPPLPDGPFDTIVCISVVSALTRNNRAQVLTQIQGLLSQGGLAYIAVPRNLPVTGKLGMHHSCQNYVVLTLPSVYFDSRLEIYRLPKTARYKDRTKDFLSERDKRRLP